MLRMLDSRDSAECMIKYAVRLLSLWIVLRYVALSVVAAFAKD